MADVLTTTPGARVTYHSTADGEVSFETDAAGVIHGATDEQARAAIAMGIVPGPEPAPRARPRAAHIPAAGAASTEDTES